MTSVLHAERATTLPPIRVIINADDFGLTEEIDRAVELAYRAGTLTSATLIVNGDSAKHAAAVARRCSGLGVGVHLNLVLGMPVASDVPSLLRADGSFLSRRELIGRALSGRLRIRDVRRELAAQLAVFCELGLVPTHLDAHQHAQAIPVVSGAVAELARANGLPVRLPIPRWGSQPTARRLRQRVTLSALCVAARAAGIRPATDDFASVFDLGPPRLVAAESYATLIRTSRGRTLEIMVHPSMVSERLRVLHPDLYPISLREGAVLGDPRTREVLQGTGASFVTFAHLADH